MPSQQASSSEALRRSETPRSLRLLVGIAGLALAAFGLLGALALLDESGVAGFESQEGYLLPDLRDRQADVARVEILGPGAPITLAQQDGTWRLMENGGYPAEGSAVDAAVRSLAELRAAHVSDDAVEPERHGVADPGSGYGAGTAVTLRDRHGTALARLVLGPPFSTPGEAVEPMLFARVGEDRRVWLAAGTLEIAADPLAWLDRDIADIPRAQVVAVTTTAPDGQRLAIRRAADGELAVAEGLSPDMRLKGPGVLHSVVSLMEQMRFEAVRPLAPAAEAAERWEAAVETDRGVTYRIQLVERVADGYWGTIAAEAGGEAAPDAARVAAAFNERHGRWAYLLPAYATERLATRPQDLAQ